MEGDFIENLPARWRWVGGGWWGTPSCCLCGQMEFLPNAHHAALEVCLLPHDKLEKEERQSRWEMPPAMPACQPHSIMCCFLCLPCHHNLVVVVVVIWDSATMPIIFDRWRQCSFSVYSGWDGRTGRHTTVWQVEGIPRACPTYHHHASTMPTPCLPATQPALPT